MAYEKNWEMELEKILDARVEGNEETITSIYKWIGPSEKLLSNRIEIRYLYTVTFDRETRKMKKAVHEQITDKPLKMSDPPTYT